ncbi:hypothetical protein [Nostoc sp. FACHB-888]|uniref:hypothetical protein n=1 Tax=Nostoc sp. FACHB-888 TaxID=2692842 RepID=UPI001682FB2E|nr:hypothetical protein [Nostoc sp. FACHB-888]MBD2247261.1 hypothetical protein [Nostoc sp. FACHB-888]
MLTEANTNKLYIPGSFLKGILRPIREQLAYFSDGNTDKEIVISCSTGSGKSFISFLFIAYYQKIKRIFYNSFYNDLCSGKSLITKSKLNKTSFRHEGKTEKLERVNTIYQESLRVNDYHAFFNDSAMTILNNICHHLDNFYRKIELFIHKNINLVKEYNSLKLKICSYLIAVNLINHHNKMGKKKLLKNNITNILRYPKILNNYYLINLNIKVILENIVAKLITSQYLLLLLARIYIGGFGKSLKLEIKLIYDLVDDLFNCVLIASIPP